MENTELLGFSDYIVIVVYLVIVVAIGSFMARGQKNSDDYFVASRRMHWFPLALSIWASLTSANSMLGGPSYGYSQDLQYIPIALTSIVAAVFAIQLILPILYPLTLTTSYTYLEHRFGLVVRCVGSALFILLRGGWLASVIYAPSLALSAVIPIPAIDEALRPLSISLGISGSTIFWIVVVGTGATIYTTLGGLKAVIWTDVVQFFVFVIGLGAIWFLLLKDLGGTDMMKHLGKIPRSHAASQSEAKWGETVELDGSKSISFDDTSLVYQWRQRKTAVSESPTVTLTNSDQPQSSFVAPNRPEDGEPVELTFTLNVTTEGSPPLQSAPATVKITIMDDPDPKHPALPPEYHQRPHNTWFDFSTKFIFSTGLTFWLLLIGNTLSRLNDAGTDQVALQRYFSAPTMKSSKRAIWVNAICDLPLMSLLYLTGAGVLVYYAVHHHSGVPISTGQVMPYFVAHKLNLVVPGLAGLFIAALFAATMSSVDSGINSISAALTTDWYRRLIAKNREEGHYLGVARMITLVLGVLGTCVAMFLGRIGELWQIAVALMGFWTGPLLGIFLLGFFTKRANSVGTLIGATVGLVCTTCFWQAGGNEFLYSLVGVVPTVVLGYLFSLFVGKPPSAENVHHLTAWTRKKEV